MPAMLMLLALLASTPAPSDALMPVPWAEPAPKSEEYPRPIFRWEQPKPYEVAMLGTSLALIWIDVFQTRAIRDPTRIETNPILGDHPSKGRVFWLGGVAPSILLTATWYALPTGWRIVPCGAVIGGEAYAIMMNARY